MRFLRHCIGDVGGVITTGTVLTEEQLIRQATDALIDKLDLMEATASLKHQAWNPYIVDQSAPGRRMIALN